MVLWSPGRVRSLFSQQFLFVLQFTVKATMSSSMRAAQFTPGGPENISIGQVPIPDLRESEVLVKVYATAINRADTLQRKGRYPPPPGDSNILGLEAAGIVDKIGPGCVSSKWKVGDRVMMLVGGGGNAEYVAVHENHMIRVPGSMSLNKAAAIPEVWLTAYQLLHFVGKLSSSDTVLIHAGGSGVGTAAVQLVKQAGAKSIVTAGSQAKIDTAVKLGASQGFNYKEGPWAEKVLNATGGAGVNLVLDCIGASYWEQNTDVLAREGRWVLYGSMGGVKVEGDILAKVLRKWITLSGTTLRTRSIQYKTDLVADFTAKAVPLFESGVYQTIIDRIMPLEQLAEAHAVMESNQNTGKIVIQVREEEKQEL